MPASITHLTRIATAYDRTSLTLWSACTLTHRFFTYESFKRRDRLVRPCLPSNTPCLPACIPTPHTLHDTFQTTPQQLVAAAAVFLGGKMAENARRLLDVVGHYYALKNKTPNLPPEKSKGRWARHCFFLCVWLSPD